MIVKCWATPNWGDAINAELVRLISGQEPEVVKAKELLDVTNYLVVGSTMKFADNNTIVWGAGFLTTDEDFQGSKPTILAVRGPKTRKRVLQLGFECSKIYGDPVLLFPRYYKPQVEKMYELGIIPHWEDEFHPVVENMVLPKGVIKIPHNLDKYEFIDMICSCKKVASSSLHGLIVADAYGIPNTHIQFNPQNMFKFSDYFQSVNRRELKPLDCGKEMDIDKILNSVYNYTIKIDLDKLMSVCPFVNHNSKIGKKTNSKKIIISPFSKQMRNGKKNPKNYPYWKEVVEKLKGEGFYVVQVGVMGEELIGADEVCFNKSLEELEALIKESVAWVSIDNFFPHLCKLVGKKGAVIFSKSDPKIFGYQENVNLLKDEAFLKKKQFDTWEAEEFDADSFVEVSKVLEGIRIIIEQEVVNGDFEICRR